MLIDTAGDDTYRTKEGNKPGFARFDARFAEAAAAANDSVWLDPPDSENRAVRNFSIGVDREGGEVDFRARPERPPSAQR
jgi:hypothetical protein